MESPITKVWPYGVPLTKVWPHGVPPDKGISAHLSHASYDIVKCSQFLCLQLVAVIYFWWILQGLFHRIIAQSGSFISSFTHWDKRAGLYGNRLASAMGCPGDPFTNNSPGTLWLTSKYDHYNFGHCKEVLKTCSLHPWSMTELSPCERSE